MTLTDMIQVFPSPDLPDPLPFQFDLFGSSKITYQSPGDISKENKEGE
jgi:hypothetical protein